jgi:hypothetical protein
VEGLSFERQYTKDWCLGSISPISSVIALAEDFLSTMECWRYFLVQVSPESAPAKTTCEQP